VRTSSLLVTALAAVVFALSAIRTVALHRARLVESTPAGFLVYLEMAGWVVLVLASGAALARVGSGLLWASTGAVGVGLVVVSRLQRGRSHDRG
jgi:hypothetical protein